MGTVANKEIRDAAKNAGICLWQIAEELGISDGNFSRKLRRELTTEDRKAVMDIIRELSRRKKEED